MGSDDAVNIQDILDEVNDILDDLQPGQEGGHFYDFGDDGIAYGPL